MASPIKSSQRPGWWRRNWFYVTLITLAIVGVFCAFFLPPLIPGINSEGETTDSLRKAILAVLAGSLTMLTLSETHRKNNQEKEKNERDHIRQVHAERRSRYTKAVEQLSNEKAAVRLGGIYTLVGLVDEWLADNSLAEDKQKEEGQVIINNLCSYIRSPFPLAAKIEEYEARKELEKLQKTESENLREAESSRFQVLLRRFKDSGEYKKPKNISADYAKFHEEQDVRRAIFVEMSKRSSTFTMNEQDEIIETVPGIWSDFDFDFSRAPIFYPLSSLTVEKGNFSSANFYSNADFSWAVFTQKANFNGAAFTQTARFGRATFAQNADFSWAVFTQKANFNGAAFTQTARFKRATFAQNADFSWAAFTQTADFSWVKFAQNANFNGAAFTQTTNFSGAKFTQTADFNGAKFTRAAYFSGTKFTQTADFRGATFAQTAYFRRATFEKYSPLFVTTDDESGKTYRARFVALPKNQEAHNFTVSEGSFPILLGEAELGNGAKHHIPVGTVLFDPDSWDEENQKYTRVSDPAKPLKNSDVKEEKPTE